MKKVITTAVLALIVFGLKAQIVDTARVCVFYKATFMRHDQETPRIEKDLILSLGDKVSKYECGIFSATKDTLRELRYGSTAHRLVTVYKNFPATGQLTCCESIANNNFRYREEMPEIKWQMVEGDSTVAGFRCNKATGELRGHVWTVWYTFDIPYPNGPWKLGGLPGLILWAGDDTGNYSYECIGITQNMPLKITFNEKHFQECTGKDAQKQHTLYWKDQAGYVARGAGIPQAALNKGDSEYRQKSFRAVFDEVY